MRASQRRRLCLSGVALLAAAAACGQADTGDQDRRIASTQAALISAGDADSLAAAALLERGTAALDLIARASAAAPQRRDLALLHVQFCARETSCDLAPVLAHLHELDPRNAAAQSAAFDRTPAVVGAEESRARLAALAEAERYDVYWNSLIAHATSAIIKTHTMDASSAEIVVIGRAGGAAIPAYQPLTSLCRGDALLDAKVLADCRRLTGVLRRGDTYLTEMLGTSIAKRVWGPGDPEYQDALRARRTVDYRIAMQVKLAAENRDEQSVAHHLQLLASQRTEQEASVAELVSRGVPPNPPDDWRDTQKE